LARIAAPLSVSAPATAKLLLPGWR
jgi:hypothetical protein